MQKKFRCTTVLLATALSVALAGPAGAQTSSFHGVNWADTRDNYASDALILSGTSSGDSYSTRKAIAQRVAQQFKAALSGVNTVRIPINPPTAGSPTWSVYRGVIDGLRAEGMTVIIGYWEPNGGNGRIPNQSTYNTMWDTVVAAYQSDSGVIFEPMNEPRGYSASEWFTIAANWISRYSSLSRSRILIDGEGYSDRATTACADSRLMGTRISVHDYAFSQGAKNYNDWMADLKNRIGSCASRAILTEFGTFMDRGYNFNAGSSINEVVYFQGMTQVARDMGIGTVYWPGLRDGDNYSMTTRSGSGSSLTLSVVDSSARDRLRYGWGY